MLLLSLGTTLENFYRPGLLCAQTNLNHIKSGILPKIISSQFCGGRCEISGAETVKTFDMGNVYTRMQSETSEDENARQSQKRNDAIVVFHKIVMGDFKEWYNTSRYFAVETPVRKDVKLDVGQTKKANLTVNIIKSRGSDDQIRVQIINASDFEICLGGEVYLVEGEIRHKIMRARTPTVLLRTFASSCATIVQSNLRPTSRHDGGGSATDLFLDVRDVVPQSATLAFAFKFFPLNFASKKRLKSVSKMESTAQPVH